MTVENEARGRSNLRRGKAWMRSCVRWLREHGAPHADVVTTAHSSDITGVGDLAIEATLEDWQRIGAKADQAAADASRRGVDYWCVWKSRRGVTDPGGAWCITTFGQWWGAHQELAELRAEVRLLRKVIREGAEEDKAAAQNV